MLIKKGKNPEKVKCALLIGQVGKYNNDFLMLSKNDDVKLRIKLHDIEKITKFPRDDSWEFGTRDGKTFRFRAETEEENRRWFDALDGFVNKRDAPRNGGGNGGGGSSSGGYQGSNQNSYRPPAESSSSTLALGFFPNSSSGGGGGGGGGPNQQSNYQPDDEIVIRKNSIEHFFFFFFFGCAVTSK